MEKELRVLAGLLIFLVAMLAVLCASGSCKRAPVPELEQRAATALAAHEALAARAAAILAEQAARPPAQAAAILMEQPYAAQGRASETLCAICVEPLRQGQLCSQVPTCQHVFHKDCLGGWAKSKGTSPLCRAKIVSGSDEVPAADDIV